MSIFTEPVLSACIVMYNSGMQVLHTVQCFQESNVELELHAVDNAPNGTLGIHLQWQCPGLIYSAQRKNMGYSGGHNFVLPFLQSQYHLLCHPDVTFDDHLLSNMIAYMDRHTDCVILTPKIVDEDGKEIFLPKRTPTLKYLLSASLRRLSGPFKAWYEEYTLADSDLRTPTSVEVANGCFLLIRTSALRQLKGLDPKFFYSHADSDLSRRALEIGRIVYHPEMIVTHHQQEKSRNLLEICKRLGESIRYLNKWGWAGTNHVQK